MFSSLQDDLQPSRRCTPEVLAGRQPEDRARVVHAHHPHDPGQWSRRYRYWLDDQNTQLQPKGNRQSNFFSLKTLL